MTVETRTLVILILSIFFHVHIRTLHFVQNGTGKLRFQVIFSPFYVSFLPPLLCFSWNTVSALFAARFIKARVIFTRPAVRICFDRKIREISPVIKQREAYVIFLSASFPPRINAGYSFARQPRKWNCMNYY